jgi:hypothetical protein
MKKFLVFVLALTLAFFLVACGGGSSADDQRLLKMGEAFRPTLMKEKLLANGKS